MFSKLVKKLFNEKTNIDSSPVTFNSPGSYNPRYGKVKGSFVTGKAQDGSVTPGFYYDNSYYTTDAVFNSPTYHSAVNNPSIVSNVTALGSYLLFTNAAEPNTWIGYYENTYNENANIIVQGYTYAQGYQTGNAINYQRYYQPAAFDPGNTQNAPYNSPLGTNFGVYSLQYRSFNGVYNGVPGYTMYASGPNPWGSLGPGYAYYSSYPTNGDYDYWVIFSTGAAGNWNAPNAYGALRTVYSNTYLSYTRYNGWTEVGAATGNYVYTYHPGTSGNNSPVTNSGTSYSAFGVTFSGGYGSTAPTVPTTSVTVPTFGSSSTNLTIPSGGYVTITFKI
jgi:hypothetical protein